MQIKSNSISKKDILIVVILLGLTVLYLIPSIFYINTSYDLINFNVFSCASKNLLFDQNHTLSLNKDIANVPPAEAMPLCYPPGIYFITRLLSLINDNLLTMHIFIFLLQLVTILFLYLSLRKIANRIVSISFTFFLIVYMSNITVVVDNYIQPLLSIIVFLLLSTENRNKYRNLILGGFLTGLVFFIRQNVGVFLTNAVLTWLLFSNLSFNRADTVSDGTDTTSYLYGSNGVRNKNRRLMWGIAIIYLILGGGAIKIINNIDDKIWYVFCYVLFWLVFLVYCYLRKDMYLNINEFSKNVLWFFIPLGLILGSWFYFFGAIVGIKKYLYIQYIMPFKFIKVFEYPLNFHITAAYKDFIRGIMSGSKREIYYNFIGFMNWGVLLIIPFLFAFWGIIWIVIKIIAKKNLETFDLKIASFPAVGMLMFYPIEAFWILSSKLTVFFVMFAYFLMKVWSNKQKMVYLIVLIFLCLSIPPFFIRTVLYLKNIYIGRYSSFIKISGVKIPRENGNELKKSINLIKNTIGDSKFYALDGFTCLETYYKLINYKHRNYYLFTRRDALNDEAVKYILESLKYYPFILINKKDYSLYISKDSLYLSGGKLGRSVPNRLMEYVMKNYEIVAQYDKPANLNDNFLSSFYILKKG